MFDQDVSQGQSQTPPYVSCEADNRKHEMFSAPDNLKSNLKCTFRNFV